MQGPGGKRRSCRLTSDGLTGSLLCSRKAWCRRIFSARRTSIRTPSPCIPCTTRASAATLSSSKSAWPIGEGGISAVAGLAVDDVFFLCFPQGPRQRSRRRGQHAAPLGGLGGPRRLRPDAGLALPQPPADARQPSGRDAAAPGRGAGAARGRPAVARVQRERRRRPPKCRRKNGPRPLHGSGHAVSGFRRANVVISTFRPHFFSFQRGAETLDGRFTVRESIVSIICSVGPDPLFVSPRLTKGASPSADTPNADYGAGDYEASSSGEDEGME